MKTIKCYVFGNEKCDFKTSLEIEKKSFGEFSGERDIHFIKIWNTSSRCDVYFR